VASAAAPAPVTATEPVVVVAGDTQLDPAACSIEAMRDGGECEACQ
jgi:hypothetical protein